LTGGVQTVNVDNLTPAQTNAIMDRGTNNAVIGNSLVKRGVMTKTETGFPKKYVLSEEFVIQQISDEKQYADAIAKEEDETPTSEEWEMKEWDRQQAEEREALAVSDEWDGVPPTDPADLPRVLDEMVPAVIVRDPKETRYAHVDRWTDDNLDVKRGILEGRLRRKTLMKSDRMQAERHLAVVRGEIEKRSAK
jgi:hypothetical protein